MIAHLFIPCLVEDLFPEIGEASVALLSRAGVQTHIPPGQTCCGQPLLKNGDLRQARPLAARFLKLFKDAESIVSPSGSCVRTVRSYPALFENDPIERKQAEHIAARTFELTEFLVDRLGVEDFGASFFARAVYHDSCQVGRGLGIRKQPQRLLQRVQGLTLVPLRRPTACCGFGGLFSLRFPNVSEAILDEKIADITASEADVVISAEVSCLLNISGRLKRLGLPIRALHIAQVLVSQGNQL